MGQPLKICIHSKHESTSNQPTEGNKKVFQRNHFILIVVSSCNGSSLPMWMQVSKSRHALKCYIRLDFLKGEMFCFMLGRLKGAEQFKKWTTVTSCSTTTHQEMQSPGMDVYPHTLPVCPLPASPILTQLNTVKQQRRSFSIQDVEMSAAP